MNKKPNNEIPLQASCMMEGCQHFHQVILSVDRIINPPNTTKALAIQLILASMIYILYGWIQPTIITIFSSVMITILLLDLILPHINSRLPEIEEKEQDHLYDIFRTGLELVYKVVNIYETMVLCRVRCFDHNECQNIYIIILEISAQSGFPNFNACLYCFYWNTTGNRNDTLIVICGWPTQYGSRASIKNFRFHKSNERYYC